MLFQLVGFIFVPERVCAKKDEITGSDVAAYACQFVGNSYVSAGVSLTNGADCSGFVLAVYAHFGVAFSHSSYVQWKECPIHIDNPTTDKLQPGDIIGYGGHVALYLGDGRIVHASNPETGIKISDSWNYRAVEGVGRVFEKAGGGVDVSKIPDHCKNLDDANEAYKAGVKGGNGASSSSSDSSGNNNNSSGNSGNNSPTTTTTDWHGDGSWVKIGFAQGSSGFGFSKLCTWFTVFSLMQNSGTLKKEYQLADDEYVTTEKAESVKSKDFFQDAVNALWTSGFSGAPTGGGLYGRDKVLPFYQDWCNKGTWSDELMKKGNNPNSSLWTFTVGLNNKDFADMTWKEVLASLQAMWNQGYFVICGINDRKDSAPNNGPTDTGIDKYCGRHWVWLCGCDDGNAYFCDSATGSGGTNGSKIITDLKTKYGSPDDFILNHCVCLKNTKVKCRELADSTATTISEKNNAGKVGDPEVGAQIIGVSTDAFWGEENLGSYMKLSEFNINEILVDASRENLTQPDLTSLSDWEDNISEEFILVRILRVIVMLVGILLTIWSILVYIAFWFDRLNPFIAVDTLGILTIGKFHAAAEDKDSNFNLNNIIRDKVVVGHRDVILISIIGLIFSSLVLTGKLFTMIAALVNFVLRFLGI